MCPQQWIIPVIIIIHSINVNLSHLETHLETSSCPTIPVLASTIPHVGLKATIVYW